MKKFQLYYKGETASIVLEKDAVRGMTDMAEILCHDIGRVTDHNPTIVEKIEEASEYVILMATSGSSMLLDVMEEAGDIDLAAIHGKREVYGLFFVESERTCGRKVLVIAGSDKRGTIYGMFRLSEEIGVSPWVFWADAVPEKKKEIILDTGILCVSKEPSVTYRGFFINDEQPCFGNWAKEKYGSVKPGPSLYRHIFELLLRLKGNYIWPAMWRSDFTYDEIENARLADRMGVIVGASHHEPCCRSGGEFQKLCKDHPQYGTEWSMISNADGIREFWKDGLMRNREFESLITIGMRGENDSYLMPEDATLEDNINVLKAAITEQKKLIEQYGNQDHPQLLAIYKEVEDYYQGDENTAGLKEWDVLQKDIMMLCDDNFGNVRTLPGEEERKRPGGYGMYYHFDYYGGPVSYLWMNSTPLTKIWEQMGMAYDYGVREAWIVNVGDIKNQELPLSYFLDLAYDFDRWGTKAPNMTTKYIQEWCKKLGFSQKRFDGLEEIIEEYSTWNGMCRPEVLRPMTYHSTHYNEAKRMLDRVGSVLEKTEKIWGSLDENDRMKECFFQLVYYPVAASANIIQMQIYAGFNEFYVKQRKKLGNQYSLLVESCIIKDRELEQEYHTRNNGKWNHMQSVFHIGYIGWNDEEWQYPDCRIYHPVTSPRLVASVDGTGQCSGGNPWRRQTLLMSLCDPIKPASRFEVGNAGEGVMRFHIVWDSRYVSVEPESGAQVLRTEESGLWAEVEDVAAFTVRIKHNTGVMTEGLEYQTRIAIYGDNCEETAECSENEYSETRVDIDVKLDVISLTGIENSTFVESDGILSMEAVHYAGKEGTGEAKWECLWRYGKTLGGVKVFPVTSCFSLQEEAPSIQYSVYAREAGRYTVYLLTAPANPVVYQGKMKVALAVNKGEYRALNTIPDEGYIPWLSPDWAKGVLEQIHVTTAVVDLRAGVNTLSIKAMDPAVVLEKIVLVREGVEYPDSYLGPQESYRISTKSSV